MLRRRERGMSACSLSVCVEREWTKELVRFKGGDVLLLRVLIFILIVVPIIEIWALLQVGEWIGAWPTVLAVIATGIVGGYLARWQGLQTYRLAQLQMQRGELPGDALLDGICILTGGLLLLTPGFFTDSVGFVLLLPLTRGVVKLWLKRWFNRLIRDGTIITIRRWH